MSEPTTPAPGEPTPEPSGQVPPAPQAATPPPAPEGTTPPPYAAATPPAYATPAPGAPLSDAETRQWASLAHLGGILFWPPSLIIWLIYKDRSPFVRQESLAALNFQLTLLIGGLAVLVLDWVFLPFGLTSLLRLALWVVSLIFSIQGYQAVQRGQAYTYPFSLQLIK